MFGEPLSSFPRTPGFKKKLRKIIIFNMDIKYIINQLIKVFNDTGLYCLTTIQIVFPL